MDLRSHSNRSPLTHPDLDSQILTIREGSGLERALTNGAELMNSLEGRNALTELLKSGQVRMMIAPGMQPFQSQHADTARGFAGLGAAGRPELPEPGAPAGSCDADGTLGERCRERHRCVHTHSPSHSAAPRLFSSGVPPPPSSLPKWMVPAECNRSVLLLHAAPPSAGCVPWLQITALSVVSVLLDMVNVYYRLEKTGKNHFLSQEQRLRDSPLWCAAAATVKPFPPRICG